MHQPAETLFGFQGVADAALELKLFEMLRQRMLKTIEKSGGLSRKLLSRALEIGALNQSVGKPGKSSAVVLPASPGEFRSVDFWVSVGPPMVVAVRVTSGL